MDIIPFKKIKGSGYSFGKIWDTYDEQFRILRDAYLTLNDSFVVEEFTDTIDKTKRLKNSYTPGQVFVYINNVIQWKDVDYEETDGNTITLLKDIVNTDKVRIITIHVNQLRDTSQASSDTGSAYEASTSAANAKNSADEASISAANAKNSETLASSYKTVSVNSALSASSSALSAKASADEAKNHLDEINRLDEISRSVYYLDSEGYICEKVYMEVN